MLNNLPITNSLLLLYSDYARLEKMVTIFYTYKLRAYFKNIGASSKRINERSI